MNLSGRRITRLAAHALAVLGILVGLCTPAVASSGRDARGGGPVVATSDGPLVGTRDGDTLHFLGVPYAAPPVGDRRWRPPAPVAARTVPLRATTPGKPCAQTQDLATTNEDCLYLNVTRPAAHRDGGHQPVMVWLHGGGNSEGAGSEFDPRRLALRAGAVVVTVNYRLGVFGFFGYPGMRGSGTFGLQDQQAALTWVHRNARAFGGNPHNVTLFGESSGAIDTCGLLTSPRSRGLFAKVILQSGSCSNQGWMVSYGHTTPSQQHGSSWAALPAVRSRGLAAAAGLGCPAGPAAMSCLRRLPAKTLLGTNPQFSVPAYGDATLPVDPATAIATGRYARIPVLFGHTHDEGRLLTSFAEWGGPAITASRFTQLTREAFGSRATEVQQAYPVPAYPTPGAAWAALDGDRSMICPMLRDGRALAQHAPAFAYEFTDENAPPYAPFPPGAMPPGASHGSELAYLFDLPGKPVNWQGQPVPLTAPQQRLADSMVGMWSQFARSGDPGGDGTYGWPRFAPHAPSPQSRVLAPSAPDGPATVDAAREHHCGLWDDMDR